MLNQNMPNHDYLCAVNDFWSSTEHWFLWKEDAVNDWFHSHAKFTPRAARSHGWGVKACGSSFAEITEFLTQFQTWHRQNCSCSRAGISSSSRTEAASALPTAVLQWDRDTQQTALGGMASRRNPKPQLLIPVQPSKLGHCRCGVKILSNAPEIQLSVILSPTEQRCHTRINSGRLQSLWNSWFLTHHLFIIHFFFTVYSWNASLLNLYCFPGVWRNWNGKFITDPSSQRSQDLFFKYSLIHVNPRVKPVVLGRIKLTQWGGRGGEEKPHNKGWNTWDFLDNLHLMLYLLTD